MTRWGTQLLTYDANGNLTSDGINTYGWDARNQLASIAGQTSASFRYDAFGRRSSKVIDGSSVSFLYDGQNPVQELAGSTPAANLLNGLFVDQFFSRTDASGTSTYLIDAVNSTIALADEQWRDFNVVHLRTVRECFCRWPGVDERLPVYGARKRFDRPVLLSRQILFAVDRAVRVGGSDATIPNDFGRALSLQGRTRIRTPTREIIPAAGPILMARFRTAPIVIPWSPFPNGNLLPGFTDQDNECSLGGRRRERSGDV